MESLRFRNGANYCNSQDDLGCIISEFGKIILLFFSLYEAHILDLQGAPSLVKCNFGERIGVSGQEKRQGILGVRLRLLSLFAIPLPPFVYGYLKECEFWGRLEIIAC